jgi:hypothetical protein
MDKSSKQPESYLQEVFFSTNTFVMFLDAVYHHVLVLRQNVASQEERRERRIWLWVAG